MKALKSSTSSTRLGRQKIFSYDTTAEQIGKDSFQKTLASYISSSSHKGDKVWSLLTHITCRYRASF